MENYESEKWNKDPANEEIKVIEESKAEIKKKIINVG